MTEEEKKAPELRFKGFVDDWEQRKLGEISESYSGGTPSVANQSYYGGSIPFIRSAEINSKNTELYLTEEGLNNSSAKLVEEGDILYALYGATSGEVGISQINGAINQAILAIKPKIEYDSNFIMQWLRRQKNSIISTYLQGGQGNLSGGIVKDLTLCIPTEYEEQTTIGSFFKQLDDTIALHQRKLTLLEQLKQTYLEVMFPQGDEKNPSFRFTGFSEPWEQRNFDEVFSHLQNNTLSRAELNYDKGYAMNIHYGDILIRFGEYLDVSKYKLPLIANDQLVEKYKASFLKDGDIVIADAAEDETVGKCSEIGDLKDAHILAGLHTIPCRPNWAFASGYLGYYMNSSAFHDQLLPLIQGTKISSISKSALKKTDIKYPYGKDEQAKIGNLFKQLDGSISLHQSKLEKLTDLKQVLLAKMFV